jgi:glutamate-1-semialdehyde 2,1-aminomutase
LSIQHETGVANGSEIGREAMLARAARVIPNGALTARTALHDLIVRSQGAYLWNSDGKRYIDYLLSGGAIVVGHCDPRVNRAVVRAAASCDLNWVGPQPGEVELAESICEVMPCAEKVNFFETGGEALLQAVRLARAVTGRRRLLSFHGAHNNVGADIGVVPRLGYADGSVHPLELGSVGPHVNGDIIFRDWNDLQAARSVFAGLGSEISAVVCEPYVHSFGCVAPAQGFLEGLRELCSRHGSLLVFDELKTSFRAHLGGYQAVCNVTPDMAVFGNAIGNGWTLAGLAGRTDLMDDLGRKARTYPSPRARPYALAAGLATFEILKDGGIDRLNELGDRMRTGLMEVVLATDVEACVVGLGSNWTLYFRAGTPTNYKEAVHGNDHGRARAYWIAMVDEGIVEPTLPPGDRRLCVATSEEDIDITIEAASRALQRASSARYDGSTSAGNVNEERG